MTTERDCTCEQWSGTCGAFGKQHCVTLDCRCGCDGERDCAGCPRCEPNTVAHHEHAMTTERCPDCFRPLATTYLNTGALEDSCWRKFDTDTCQREPDLEAQRTAERARFELSRDWRDTGAAEKERHWQTWCAAMRIKR